MVHSEKLAIEQLQEVQGGHMLYRKCIVDTEEGPIFIKSFDGDLFSDKTARAHNQRYLAKEYATYLALQESGFPHLPSAVGYQDDSLFMTAHSPAQGWHWELPADDSEQHQYTHDILTALSDLSLHPHRPDALHSTFSAIQEFAERGWLSLEDQSVRMSIRERFRQFATEFHPHVQSGIDSIDYILASGAIANQQTVAYSFPKQDQSYVGHFDARQSNIAWHPEEGVSIVDWSWASGAPAKCDTTMFLIDLYKSDYDVSGLMEAYFDPDFATLLTGYWIARCIAPTPSDDQLVRFHQAASAATAATLLGW